MINTQWFLKNKKGKISYLSDKYGISPILAKILINKGINEDEFDRYLHPLKYTFYDNIINENQNKAASLLIYHIKQKNNIRVIGDYDVDGIMSTFILVSSLEELKANVSYDIPHRINDGYGINEDIVQKCKDDNISLIITCDNGISAFDAVLYARNLGIDIIITDHHSVKTINDNDILPNANYIINPHLQNSTSKYKIICGAFVAYKFIMSIYETLNIEQDSSLNKELLIAATLATICDVMPLMDENRILVALGLQLIKDTTNIGLKALLHENNIDVNFITTYHIGFIIGPSLNASGRLKSAKIALKLLFCTDDEKAFLYARELISLNDERKQMTENAKNTAIDIVNKQFYNDKILVIYLPDAHESVAGIIAGRIKEHYNKPTIVFTNSEGDILKGSGRSINAYNMIEQLNEASNMLIKYGGHMMAAGMSICKDKLDDFRLYLNTHCTLTDNDFINKKYIDVHLPFSYISFDLINELSILEPFGNSNEKPIFAHNNIKILDYKIFGQNKNVIKMTLMDRYKTKINAILFDNNHDFADNILFSNKYITSSISILYYPQINTFNNFSSIQILINDYKLHE